MRKIIQETLEYTSSCKKEFTKQLNKMEKTCGKRYTIDLYDDERQSIFDLISNMVDKDNDKKETQYNIFRLAKYLISNGEVTTIKIYKYMQRFLWAVMHDYGNIRTTSWEFASKIHVPISNMIDPFEPDEISLKTIKENKKLLYPLIAEVFIVLQNFESAYQKENINKLSSKDIYNGGDFISQEETKDKILKSIRKGMEIRDVGNIVKIMKSYGFLPLYKSNDHWSGGGRYLPEVAFKLNVKKGKHTNVKSKKETEAKRKKIKEALHIFLSTYNLPFDVQNIVTMIYNSDENMRLQDGKKYMQFWMDIFDKYDIDFSQNLIDLLTDCWNYFPQKTLKDKCPAELFKG